MLIMIDNYDSFTYNLVQYFGDLEQKITVHRNDKITVDAVLALSPTGIVISPGPGTPENSGICLELIKKTANANIPLLGICLGHQAIGQAFGGKVIRGPEPMHGKIADITHTATGVFNGLPSPYKATRYHSLIIERDTLPNCLAITAETDDRIIMGVSHKDKPIHGIQYHPESYATENGHALLKNFVDIVTDRIL